MINIFIVLAKFDLNINPYINIKGIELIKYTSNNNNKYI